MFMNNIKITNLPENTNLSLSGVTIVVENEIASQVTLSDIKDLVLSGFSGGGGGVITTTYTNLQSLVSSNQLIPGSIYKITGFNRNMPNGGLENPYGYLPVVLYDDGTNSGTTIYLQAITTNTLSESGYGEFYNPKYYITYSGGSFNPLTVEQRLYTKFTNALNQQVGIFILDDYLIMHSLVNDNYYLINFTQWTQNNGGGGFSYTRQLITPTMSSPIITFTKTNGGNQIDVIEPGVLEITRGNNGPIYNTIEEGSSGDNSPIGTEWSRNGMSLYNFTGGTGLYGIWDGDNPVSGNTPDYQVGQVVFWGGYAWENLTGSVGSSLNILNLSPGDWEKLPYSNSTYYEKVIDEIKVDLNNGILIGRTNIENQITVEFNAAQYEYQELYSNIQSNPISVMGWGLYSKRTTGAGYNFYGISNVKVINSLCETVSFKGTRFMNIEMNTSSLKNNYFGKDSNINDNTLTDSCSINNNTLINNSDIYNNTLTINSNINNNTSNSSSIYNNTLINSDIDNNSLDNSNIGNNTLTDNSDILTNTSNNSNIDNNTLTNDSNISSNTSNNSSIYNNTLTSSSNISSNILTNTSNINNNTLSDNSDITTNTSNISNISNNTLTNNGNIDENAFTGCNINMNTLIGSNILNNTLDTQTLQKLTMKNTSFDFDLSEANDIFLDTEKTIFTRLDGSVRLMYYDDSDTPTIVNVDA